MPADRRCACRHAIKVYGNMLSSNFIGSSVGGLNLSGRDSSVGRAVDCHATGPGFNTHSKPGWGLTQPSTPLFPAGGSGCKAPPNTNKVEDGAISY